jgi:ribosomal protein S16
VLKLDNERYQKWISVGAQPSGTLAAVIRRTARAPKAA